MTTSRWSTLTLLSIAVLTAVLGFCVGATFHHPGHLSASTSVDENSTSKIIPDSLAQKDLAPARIATPADIVTDRADDETVVKNLLAQLATPARNEALMAALEQLARHDPLRAIAFARSETNLQLRGQMLAAAFTGWGKTDATGAADWILAQPAGSLDANAAIAALLKGAVQDPDTAVQLTHHLETVNPAQAREYGDALIYALGQNGSFQRAADFAAAATGDLRTEWLAAAYGNWSNYQPQNAAASALQISDADVRGSALDAVFPGWQQADPKGLADFAMNDLPAGEQKNRALTGSLVSWAVSNAGDAASWINQFGPAPEFDQGEAAIATQQQIMQQPDLAVSWAQTITDSNLRSRTISAIVETWMLTDPAAAVNFVQNTSDLQPDDRAGLLSKLNVSANN